MYSLEETIAFNERLDLLISSCDLDGVQVWLQEVKDPKVIDFGFKKNIGIYSGNQIISSFIFKSLISYVSYGVVISFIKDAISTGNKEILNIMVSSVERDKMIEYVLGCKENFQLMWLSQNLNMDLSELWKDKSDEDIGELLKSFSLLSFNKDFESSKYFMLSLQNIFSKLPSENVISEVKRIVLSQANIMNVASVATPGFVEPMLKLLSKSADISDILEWYELLDWVNEKTVDFKYFESVDEFLSYEFNDDDCVEVPLLNAIKKHFQPMFINDRVLKVLADNVVIDDKDDFKI